MFKPPLFHNKKKHSGHVVAAVVVVGLSSASWIIIIMVHHHLIRQMTLEFDLFFHLRLRPYHSSRLDQCVLPPNILNINAYNQQKKCNSWLWTMLVCWMNCIPVGFGIDEPTIIIIKRRRRRLPNEIINEWTQGNNTGHLVIGMEKKKKKVPLMMLEC